MSRRIIHCDNSWCATATKTHRSTYAKRRCDQSRTTSAMSLAPRVPGVTPPLAIGDGEILGDGITPLTVGFHDLHDRRLVGATLSSVVLDGAQGTNLAEAILTDCLFVSAEECSLERARAQGIGFSRHVRDCAFDEATLSGALFSDESTIVNSSFDGARLNDSAWGKAVRITDSSFRYAQMRRATFREHTSFTNCDLTGLDLSNAVIHGDTEGRPTFIGCEVDLINLSGVNLRDAHFRDVALDQRIVFADADTLPPLKPGTLDPTDTGRELLTRAMTVEQYADYTETIGVSEAEIRSALARLSPAFAPLYADGRAAPRGDLLRRALLGEDPDVLVRIQTERWEASASRNSLLVRDPETLYG